MITDRSYSDSGIQTDFDRRVPPSIVRYFLVLLHVLTSRVRLENKSNFPDVAMIINLDNEAIQCSEFLKALNIDIFVLF